MSTSACLHWVGLAAVSCGLAITAIHASARKCSGVYGRTPWETAEKEVQISRVIFVGTVQRSAMQWNILSAKSGELVRQDLPENSLRMRIAFRVKEVYKGELGTDVQVSTGIGGGDCGAIYQAEMDYLVYAAGPSPAELRVHLCSPGGWIGSNYLATEFRHLRRERPLADDLAPFEFWTPTAVARGDREREEFIRRYTAATGQICGVASPGTGAASLFVPLQAIHRLGMPPWP